MGAIRGEGSVESIVVEKPVTGPSILPSAILLNPACSLRR
jgi:hypothetical protein